MQNSKLRLHDYRSRATCTGAARTSSATAAATFAGGFFAAAHAGAAQHFILAAVRAEGGLSSREYAPVPVIELRLFGVEPVYFVVERRQHLVVSVEFVGDGRDLRFVTRGGQGRAKVWLGRDCLEVCQALARRFKN